MKVKFVGDSVRTNSFGRFEPGKTYDVSEVVGNQLLTVPSLFEEVNPKKAETNPEETIIPEEEIANSDYNKMSIDELAAEAAKRGISQKRGTRKAEFVKLLKEHDKKKE